ncbi:hypothetical protein [Aquimarina muelleri]|uniref:Uncharacterized protein n=1 Tax=Aquimarina muelleri TaxID=279356 RepID=A0A918JW10_9FLAO|nr:hypothetical protein [Aquimarina muelleri]MCX2763936.1 hypothetical protein [Aquimarina muelleri]GGX11221.1 hypothetical protein GCM10007384_11290 [Aquimarina muelleri]
MKKTLLLSFLAICIISCQSNSDFNKSGKFYKGIDNEKELYITFVNDTVVAINSDSLKTCGWNFMSFKLNEDGLYQTNELKTDTMWFKAKEKNVEMTSADDSLIFEKIELSTSEIGNIEKDIEISQNFAEKGITYGCEYTIKEVGYFYERAVEKVKNRLKNPSSAKFNEAYIHKHKTFNEDNEYVNSTTTLVSLDVEAKNGFGNFTESKYYVFFIPREDDKTKYDIEFSDSSVLDYELRDRIKFE